MQAGTSIRIGIEKMNKLSTFLITMLAIASLIGCTGEHADCRLFKELIERPGVEKSFLELIDRIVPEGPISPKDEKFGYAKFQGTFAFKNKVDLTSIAAELSDMSVELLVDEDLKVVALYVGRSGRSGMLVSMTENFDEVYLPTVITKDRLGVFCPAGE